MSVFVATGRRVLRVEPESGRLDDLRLPADRPTCLAVDGAGGLWCGTDHAGIYRSLEAGSWRTAGLPERRIMSLAVSRTDGTLWAGTEPSEVWHWRGDGPWQRAAPLETLGSASEWAFPPRPQTHHVRWIAPHPADADRLWVAIEAGALITTGDGGRSWRDRVPGGPRDTHELAVHPDAPERLRSAAGDGYFESEDGGRSWSRPSDGLEVGYLRSVAIDPGDPATVVVSAASGPRSAYVAGRADGRLYRRSGSGRWRRVSDGWPDPPATIAPLLTAGPRPGELWAADERGVHRSGDGGGTWEQVAALPSGTDSLRGLAVTG